VVPDAPDTGGWKLGEGGIRLTGGSASASASASAETDPDDGDGKRAAGNRDQEISVQDLMRRSRGQDGQAT